MTDPVDISGAEEWLDISVPLYSGMVTWPGDPEVAIERFMDLALGDSATVSRIDMGAHTGTHVDAPSHYLRSGQSLDEMPLSSVIGPARILEISDPVSIKLSDLATRNLQPGERILLKTRNSARTWQDDEFVEDFVFISQEAARYLAECRVKLVGIDYLSVGGYEIDGVETHAALLEAGIWVVEGLDLSRVEPGDYDLICLPLRIRGAEGAPARVVVRRRRYNRLAR